MRLTSLLLLSLILVRTCIAGKPAEPPNVISVPFEPYGTFILVPVQVNGSAPLSFIFDTGINRTLINPKRTRELHLGHSREFHTVPFNLTFTKGKKPTLQIGSARLEAVENLSPFFSFDDLEAALGRHVDGIFGSDLLQHYVVEIVYANHILNLYDSKSYQYTGREQPIPLQVKNHLSFVQCQIITNGGQAVNGDFAVDTGSDGAVDLAGTFIRHHKFLEDAGPTLPTTNWTAMGGENEDRVGRMKMFRVGRFTLNNPLVQFSTSAKERAGHDYAGLLGGEILQRFKLILDYSHKQMILEPNARLSEPFEWDMSGLDLDTVGADFSTYVISGVLAQSPAAEAGLKERDQLIAIDGTPATTLGLREIDRIFKQEGREIQLQIKRDKETLEIKLRLRRLI